MKNQMYITLLILPLLATGCGGRKETAQTMPVPEISVARPTVQNITLTKEYPGYLTSEKTVDLVGRVSAEPYRPSLTLPAAGYARDKYFLSSNRQSIKTMCGRQKQNSTLPAPTWNTPKTTTHVCRKP